jgi:hypothetical protein
VIAAPSQDAEAEIKDFQSKTRMNYAVLTDVADEVIGDFGLEGLPQLFIVGRDGKIAWRGITEDDPGFTETLEKALAQK